jgi:lysozyme
MKTSNKGVELIKKHEGLRLTSYICPAGKWTVGYGHTRTAHNNLTITEKQAEELLRSDLEITETAVTHMTKDIGLNQNQFDSLVSFAFNVGVTALRNSTLMRKINADASEQEIREQFGRWIYADKKVLSGLVARRKDEADLYFEPIKTNIGNLDPKTEKRV